MHLTKFLRRLVSKNRNKEDYMSDNFLPQIVLPEDSRHVTLLRPFSMCKSSD